MSRFYLLLALLLALLSPATSTTTLTDNTGNTLALPTTTTTTTSYLSTPHTHQRSTSPYHLTITIATQSTTAMEGFYVGMAGAGRAGGNGTWLWVGNVTLVSQRFADGRVGGAGYGVAGNYLGNATNPNTAAGTYTFVFTIPTLSTLRLNLTYLHSAGSSAPVVEHVELAIFNPVPSITADPQFVGLLGQQYQVHGIDGAAYNIISEEATQVNSRFVFLSSGQCPLIDGRKDVDCWLQPGSHVGEMGFQAVVDGRRHSALITAGPAMRGFAGVHVDARTLTVGDKVGYGEFTVYMQSAHTVLVTTDSFEFQLTNSDMFISQKLRARVPLSDLKAHGLIGQTHSTTTYPTKLRYIEGEVDDYVIGDSDIFGTDFVYNRFLA